MALRYSAIVRLPPPFLAPSSTCHICHRQAPAHTTDFPFSLPHKHTQHATSTSAKERLSKRESASDRERDSAANEERANDDDTSDETPSSGPLLLSTQQGVNARSLLFIVNRLFPLPLRLLLLRLLLRTSIFFFFFLYLFRTVAYFSLSHFCNAPLQSPSAPPLPSLVSPPSLIPDSLTVFTP